MFSSSRRAPLKVGAANWACSVFASTASHVAIPQHRLRHDKRRFFYVEGAPKVWLHRLSNARRGLAVLRRDVCIIDRHHKLVVGNQMKPCLILLSVISTFFLAWYFSVQAHSLGLKIAQENNQQLDDSHLLGVPANSVAQSAKSVEESVDPPSDDERKDWRYTRQGWQRIDVLPPIKTHTIRVPAHRPLPVHPFQATMLILLSALGLVAWSSSEWDWARLIRDD